MDDRLGQPGRARASTGSTAGGRTGAARTPSAAPATEEPVLPARPVQISEPHDPLERWDLGRDLRHLALPVEILAAVPVAVDRQQHLRLDLREAVDHAPRAELGRGRGPHRPDRRAGHEARRPSPGCSACTRTTRSPGPTPQRPEPAGDRAPSAHAARPMSTSRAHAARTRAGSRPRSRPCRGRCARRSSRERPGTTRAPGISRAAEHAASRRPRTARSKYSSDRGPEPLERRRPTTATGLRSCRTPASAGSGRARSARPDRASGSTEAPAERGHSRSIYDDQPMTPLSSAVRRHRHRDRGTNRATLSRRAPR